MTANNRSMKPSGVDWIETIPDSWGVLPFKYVFSLGKGLPITKADLQDEGVRVVSYGQIHSKENTGTHLSESLCRLVNESWLQTNKQSLAFCSDFLFADTSEDYDGIGNCVFVDTDELLFAGYHTIIARPKGFAVPKYLAYLFQTDSWRKQIRDIASGVKVFSVTQSILKRVFVLVPTPEEQQVIADYLDKKCAEIDGLVGDIEKQIDILERYKQSVISEAVTKGLDPTAPMKSSGIDWIGDIPCNWNVMRLKSLALLKTGHTPPSNVSEYFDGDVLWFTPVDIQNSEVEHSTRSVSQLAVEHGQVSLYAPFSTLLIAIGGTAGKVAYVKQVASSNQQITALQPINVHAKWLFYATLTQRENFFNLALFTTMPILNNEYLSDYKFAVPAPGEQQAIADYLDEKCAEIDALIVTKREQLEKLAEYKKSLIYEYVTGKKGVCYE